MKQLFYILFGILICITCKVQAQTIHKGDRFWDGETLWQVDAIYGGQTVFMVGTGEVYLSLEVVDTSRGEYKLVPSSEADEPSIPGAKFGWRVQYIRQDGMNFLAVRKPDGDAMWSMVLTPDNETNCRAQQENIDNDKDYIASNTLLNRHYLSLIPSRDKLRLLRNEIMARHGYRFQAKDLQNYFNSRSWYKPGNDNSAIRLNIIEQHNIQLIKSEEADRAKDEASGNQQQDEKSISSIRENYYFVSELNNLTDDGRYGGILVKGYVIGEASSYFERQHDLEIWVDADSQSVTDTRWVNDTEDINFDGIPDLQIFLGLNAVGRVEEFYAGYVWNPQGYFEEVKNYADIINPIVDSESKTITSTFRSDINELTICTYAWKNGNLELIQEEKDKIFDEDE